MKVVSVEADEGTSSGDHVVGEKFGFLLGVPPSRSTSKATQGGGQRADSSPGRGR
jgi:hypothetical protein